jgi:hypothetical protein
MVAGWYDRLLRMIAVNHETTRQQQLGRALICCSAKGLPALAQIERGDDSA